MILNFIIKKKMKRRNVCNQIKAKKNLLETIKLLFFSLSQSVIKNLKVFFFF
jgi:hypothetical protein